ncbi:MAG: hypothetical protein H6737_23815 [Alphaproteobacteria bacterium]|nr:hypothetical protein [Alphaproteobacteria bacterium]
MQGLSGKHVLLLAAALIWGCKPTSDSDPAISDTDADTDAVGDTDGNGDTDADPEPEPDPRDADGDGFFGTLYGGTDCDDHDAAVNPGATEVLDDDVDDDCDGFATLSLITAAPGDLVISELHGYPLLDGIWSPEAAFIEVYNAGVQSLDLDGLVVGTTVTGTQTLSTSVVLAPGELAVIGSDADASALGGLVPDITWDASSWLFLPIESVWISDGAQVLDTVDFEMLGVIPIGGSFEIRPTHLDADDNDSADAWCHALDSYGANFGNPGSLGDCQAQLDIDFHYDLDGGIAVAGTTRVTVTADGVMTTLNGGEGTGTWQTTEDGQRVTWTYDVTGVVYEGFRELGATCWPQDGMSGLPAGALGHWAEQGCPGCNPDDVDTDGDGVCDDSDPCVLSADDTDQDGDGLCDADDPCPDYYDPTATLCHVYRVDAAATGAGDGLSWADAFTTLAAAVQAGGDGAEIWVREGTYRATVAGPTGGLLDLTGTTGVAVYGGFDGTEAALADRAGRYATTVLDGDVNDDDFYGAFANRSDNAGLLVIAGGGSIVDGFTVTGGHESAGAAISVPLAASLTASHLVVEDNDASEGVVEVAGSLAMSDTVFRSNQADNAPTMVVGGSATASVVNVTLTGNVGTQASAETLNVVSGGVLDMDFSTLEMAGTSRGVRYRQVATGAVSHAALYGDGVPFYGIFSSPGLTIDYTAADDDDHLTFGTGNLKLTGATPFVVAATGQVFLAHAATGQSADALAVDAGDAAIADALAPTWSSRTTRRDGVVDSGDPDLGAHYDPGLPVVYDVVFAGGQVSWSEANSTGCTLDGASVSSPMAIPSAGWSLLCEGASGPLWAHFTCEGDPTTGDSDLDGVCDSDDPCPYDVNGDSDGDAICDSDDVCPDDPANDDDGDGFCDTDDDVCPGLYNPGQGNCTAWYVDVGATGAGDGTSWTDAYTTVQDAIDAASAGDAIYVREGVYRSADGGDFGVLVNTGGAANLGIHGGFDGTEALGEPPAGRFATTILTGDVDGDDIYGSTSARTDNANVLARTGAGTLLTGFTLMGANSNSTLIATGDFTGRDLNIEDNNGGSYTIRVNSGRLTLDRTIFRDNTSSYSTLGLQGTSSSLLQDVAMVSTGPVAAIAGLSSGATLEFDFLSLDQVGTRVFYGAFQVPGTHGLVWFHSGSLFGASTVEMFDYTAANSSTHIASGTGNFRLDGSTDALGYPFVIAATGQLFLAHTETGQVATSAAVDAGDAVTADSAAPGWTSGTTRLDGVLDTGPPDLGAHYDPGLPVVYDVSYSGGQVSWTEVNSLGCTLDGVPVSSPMTVPGGSFSLLCEGTAGPAWARFVCDGDPATGDADGDGICD